MTPQQKRFWQRAQESATDYIEKIAGLFDSVLWTNPDWEELEDVAVDAVRRAVKKMTEESTSETYFIELGR